MKNKDKTEEGYSRSVLRSALLSLSLETVNEIVKSVFKGYEITKIKNPPSN